MIAPSFRVPAYSHAMDLIRTIIIALVLAVVVAIVFSLVDPLDGYAAVAGVLTFLLVILAGFTGNLGGPRNRV